MLPELLEGAFSQTGTGYSNTEIFTHYIKKSFTEICPWKRQ